MTVSARLGITELADTQSDRSETVNEAIAKLEAGAALFGARSLGDNAPPASPVEGDIYVLGGSPTGAWSGHGEAVAVYYNAAWLFLPPLAGMIAYAFDEDAFYYYDDTGTWVVLPGSGTITAAVVTFGPTGRAYVTSTNVQEAIEDLDDVIGAYDVPMSFAGNPTAGQLLGKTMIVRDVVFPANFSGAVGHVGTNPGSTYAIDIQDDGVSIGTASISTGGAFTFTTTSGTAKTVAAGSRLEWYAPANSPADTSVSNIAATLKGRYS